MRWIDHLARLRLGKAHLAGHLINPFRLSELRLGQAQLAILFTQLLANLLFRLDAVALLDGAEVLQTINHGQRKENRDSGGEVANLAGAHRIGRLDQAAVVKALGKAELRRTHATAPQRLLGHQFGVPLGDPRAQASARFEICCCACRHGLSPQLLPF